MQNYSFDAGNVLSSGGFNPMFDFKKKGDKLAGILVGNKHDIGRNHQEIWTIKTDDGDIDIWGCSVLDRQLGNLVLHRNAVEIVYEGDSEKSPKGNPPHLFAIRVVPVDAQGEQMEGEPILKGAISSEEQSERDKIMEEMEVDEDLAEQE